MNPVSVMAVCVAMALGVWHFNLALQAILVFRTGEPISSWIAVLTGPACTLPAALLAVFTKRAGGYWLITSGILSFLVFAVGEQGATENLFPFISRISVPMTLIGAILIYLSKMRS
jgi:uncharacterized integral membrane protein